MLMSNSHRYQEYNHLLELFDYVKERGHLC